jgi:membrane protein
MSTLAAPPPIPGRPIDPPPKGNARVIRMIDDKSRAAGIGFRAFLRFMGARASLLAAGTTYYLFLAFFALVALAFGVAALIGSQRLAETIAQAIETAFPGMVGGGSGLDEQLRSFGSASSIIGLLVLLYSGAGAMTAASNSIHLIYGAPPDPRNIVWAKARLIGWMLIIAPLILLSFAPSLLVTSLAQPILDAIGFPEGTGQVLLISLSLAVSVGLNFLVMYWLLGSMGGIRPRRSARLVGASVGAVAVELLKYLMASIVAWAVARPQYGAFAVPIAALFVLYLLTITLYASAALAAGIAEKDEPLVEELDEHEGSPGIGVS